eukprot:Nk52_evm1s1208 gene=Nk52_evmTU1s1208
MSLSPKVISFEEKWDNLLVRIEAVINLREVKNVSWMGMYEDVYALCTSIPPHCERLYENISKFLEDFVNKKREEILEDGSDLLKSYEAAW